MHGRAEAAPPDFLDGGGEVGALMRRHDWASSSLGPIAAWPQSLKTTVSLLLRSPVPIVLLWGPDGVMLYNDAYSGFAGGRHPHLLGSKVLEGWPEVAEFNAHVMRVGLSGGTLSYRDKELTLNRTGAPEQVWMDLAYSPVLGETGTPAGVLAVVAETTGRVLAERRLRFQFELGESLRGLTDAEEVTVEAARSLGSYLGVARAGYGEIDRSGETVLVRRDWTDGSVSSLAGEARILDAFGPAIIDQLRAGCTLTVEDCLADPRSAGASHAATWASIGTRSLVVVPLIRGGRLTAILYLHEPRPRRWTPFEVSLAEDVANRTWDALERAALVRQLAQEGSRLEAVIENMPIGVILAEAPSGRLVLGNRQVSRIWRHPFQPLPNVDGYAEYRGFHEDGRPYASQEWPLARSLLTGELVENEEIEIARGDGSRGTVSVGSAPIHDENGTIIAGVVAFMDITDRKRAEEHQRLLINELNHRVKNTLATVQSIIAQTLRNAPGAEGVRSDLENRLLALARAHDVLTRENWEGADLRDILAQALEAYGAAADERLHLEGPAVWLTPRMALAFAMAFQELATNAAKYGALSGPAGEIRVTWSIDGDTEPRRLHLRWEEAGGPHVEPPRRRGFGSRLIERSLAQDLSGTVAIAFAPTGVVCTVEAPLS